MVFEQRLACALGAGAGVRALVSVRQQRAVTHTQAFCGAVAAALAVLAELTNDGGLRLALKGIPPLVAAWGLTRFISRLLYGLKPNDPLTIATATLVMIAAATLTAYLPARHASRIEPMEALRHE